MIPNDIREKCSNQNLDSNEKGVVLLDCILSKIEREPSDFIKFVIILESDGYLSSMAEKLVKRYCE